MAESRERRSELLRAAAESVSFAAPARRRCCLRSWWRRERSRAKPPRTRKGALGPFKGGKEPRSGESFFVLVRFFCLRGDKKEKCLGKVSTLASSFIFSLLSSESVKPVAFSLSLSLSPLSRVPLFHPSRVLHGACHPPAELQRFTRPRNAERGCRGRFRIIITNQAAARGSTTTSPSTSTRGATRRPTFE